MNPRPPYRPEYEGVAKNAPDPRSAFWLFRTAKNV